MPHLFTVLRWSRLVEFDLSRWPNLVAYLERVSPPDGESRDGSRAAGQKPKLAREIFCGPRGALLRCAQSVRQGSCLGALASRVATRPRATVA